MSDEGTPAKVRLNDELGPDAPAAVRWYCVRQDGLATWCKDERDAIATAEQCAVSWPSHGPYRAVQLVDASELQALRGLLTQALALRDAPKWPLPGCDDFAKESVKWWRAVEAALGPNAEVTGKPPRGAAGAR
jgi:hypothetical protein